MIEFDWVRRDVGRFGALICLILGLEAGVADSADLFGSTERGEGGELVVTDGVVVREVASEDGDLPLLAVGSADGIHHLYDPNQFTMQGFWSGIFGRVGKDDEFEPMLDRMRSFHLDQSPPWTLGDWPLRKPGYQWRGYEIRDGAVFFQYQFQDEKTGLSWQVEERIDYVSELLQRIHLSIEPSGETDEHLNYWVRQTEFRRLTTNGKQNQRNRLKNLFPNQKEFTITFLRRKETPTIPHGYKVDEVAVPVPAVPFLFEPTAMDFTLDGDVYVSTRTGAVWRGTDGKWSIFADGLNEANGVKVAPDGSGVYVMQRPELTLLRDTDGDGVADHYETIEDRFRFTGQYHEFAYGPKMNSAGDLFFSTGLASDGYFMATDTSKNQMTSPLGYRGWVMRHGRDGSITPFASGLRSPAGIGMNKDDELFVTDNQGDWVPSSYLAHVEKGDFLGHPASLWDEPEMGLTPKVLDYRSTSMTPKEVPKLEKRVFEAKRKLPAVWLSHGDLTNSPGHPSFAPESGFGPFGGQAFIADIAHRNVIRVALEKVAGAYQGAVFPFIRPLKSSSYSTAFDPQGNLWVGSVGRGWTAGEPALEVISFEPGAVPFEMHRIEVTKTGFDIVFTQPLADGAVEAADLSVIEYRYEYWDIYGSERISESQIPLTDAEVSEDRMVLSVSLPLKEEFIYQIQLPSLKAASGLTLENNYGIYTLNRLKP